MFVVGSDDVVNDFDAVLAAIAALEVRMSVRLSVCNEFRHLAISVRNKYVCSNRLMFVLFVFLARIAAP